MEERSGAAVAVTAVAVAAAALARAEEPHADIPLATPSEDEAVERGVENELQLVNELPEPLLSWA